jgi:hypothetical protein
MTYPSREQDESFNIDLVQLGVSGTRGRVGCSAKLDYGDLARIAGYSVDGDIALQEAFLTYDGDGVGVRLGRFATPIGYEVLEPWGNAQASRSWAWQAQPINHDGLTFGGTADVIDVMIGIVNSFTVADQDILANDADDEKGVIVSLSAGVSETFNLYVSGLYTEEQDTVDIGAVDVIVSGNLRVSQSGLRYAVEGYYRRDNPDGAGADKLWSVAAYLGHRLGGPVSISSRIEYFEDDGIVLPDTSVVSLTPTLTIELVDGVDFRVEYRFDKSDDDVFLDGSSDDDTIHRSAVSWFAARRSERRARGSTLDRDGDGLRSTARSSPPHSLRPGCRRQIAGDRSSSVTTSTTVPVASPPGTPLPAPM